MNKEGVPMSHQKGAPAGRCHLAGPGREDPSANVFLGR